MSGVALALVLLAAFAHAGWNFIAKKGGGGSRFVWLYLAAGLAILTPFAAGYMIVTGWRPSGLGIAFMAGSGLLHALYFMFLQRGYRWGDLSVVYPLARGTAPIIIVAVAVPLFHETPTPLALAGAAMVVGGVLSLGWMSMRGAAPKTTGVLYAVITGCFIAAYTLWDKQAVGPLAQAPVVYLWGTFLTQVVLLCPVALGDRAQTLEIWRSLEKEILAIGFLTPLAYVLVLSALAIAPASYVAPAREVSIVIGAFLGGQLLGEADVRKRRAASALIAAGVVAIGIG